MYPDFFEHIRPPPFAEKALRRVMRHQTIQTRVTNNATRASKARQDYLAATAEVDSLRGRAAMLEVRSRAATECARDGKRTIGDAGFEPSSELRQVVEDDVEVPAGTLDELSPPEVTEDVERPSESSEGSPAKPSPNRDEASVGDSNLRDSAVTPIRPVMHMNHSDSESDTADSDVPSLTDLPGPLLSPVRTPLPDCSKMLPAKAVCFATENDVIPKDSAMDASEDAELKVLDENVVNREQAGETPFHNHVACPVESPFYDTIPLVVDSSHPSQMVSVLAIDEQRVVPLSAVRDQVTSGLNTPKLPDAVSNATQLDRKMGAPQSCPHCR